MRKKWTCSRSEDKRFGQGKEQSGRLMTGSMRRISNFSHSRVSRSQCPVSSRVSLLPLHHGNDDHRQCTGYGFYR